MLEDRLVRWLFRRYGVLVDQGLYTVFTVAVWGTLIVAAARC